MAKTELNILALGYAGAIVSGACMLVIGVLANFGLYTDAAEMMAKWHIFFSLSAFGIFTGMIEAAVISFVFMYLFGLLYNKFA